MQDAADVTQQVFLQVFRSIGQFDGRSRFSTWVFRLTINEALQHQRRDRRWRFQVLDWEPMDKSSSDNSEEQKDLIQQALAHLEPELRAIFLLRETGEMSYEEIAQVMEIPEGTVGSRLNRARRELKRHLGDLGYEWK